MIKTPPVMDTFLYFSFRDALHEAEAYFSFEEEPYYIFLILHSQELIDEFGQEITIKTDGVQSLPRRDSYKALDALRTAAFEAAKATPAFQEKWWGGSAALSTEGRRLHHHFR